MMERQRRLEFKLHLGMTYLNDQNELVEIEGDRVAHFIENMVTPILPDYTLINALGAWEGMIEPSIILIHVGPSKIRETIKKIAGAYKVWFRQDAVYMTETIVETEVI
jgi:hypothetical protein